MAFLDIIILAAVAFFIGYRLWSVLGTHEKPIQRKRPGDEDNVVPIRASRKPAQPEGMTESAPVYSPDAFHEDHFLQGAAMAFRQIMDAFSMDDKKALKPLLSSEIYKSFASAIDDRKKKGETLEVDLPNIVTMEVLRKDMDKNIAHVTVRIVSEQCVILRNKKGEVLSGDPDHYTEITDIWTFSRDVKSADPNWILTATQVGEADA